jgi:hypothetical protein
MAIASLGVLMLFGMLVTFGLLVLALVDLVKRPAHVWEESGHNQLVWALVVIFVAVIGPVLYLVVARPALEAAFVRLPPAEARS